ncbi:MAG TPA: type II toxin-antitoxin system RelE/ParE family toxin [Nitriliruptorales bacterium]
MRIYVAAEFLQANDERACGKDVWRKAKTKIERRAGWKPMSGPLSGCWRVRVGDYRCVFEAIDDELVLVLALAHRREIYDIAQARRG